ncbi:hypothetical protein BDZ94DRAFT_136092 [Collybia nuda]|uniref:Transmembrane protein n=1 Tax=Collybia nuda TaxID=64659 RepID=A0A9P5YDQ5_9AGAR|nr:hypothetical protein BDZ94DRAFT_136092 [Collybia nuda]
MVSKPVVADIPGVQTLHCRWHFDKKKLSTRLATCNRSPPRDHAEHWFSNFRAGRDRGVGALCYSWCRSREVFWSLELWISIGRGASDMHTSLNATFVDGSLRCTSRLPYGARIAIGASIWSILLTIGLFLFLRGRRSRQRALIYQVDASQIQGPPMSYAANLDPRSVAYLQTPGIVISPAPGTAPAEQNSTTPPGRNSRPGVRPPQTAPVHQGYGGYPFPGYSPTLAPNAQPYTSYSSRFPRPLYTGQPVHKDEREIGQGVV